VVRYRALTFDPMLEKNIKKPQIPAKKACNALAPVQYFLYFSNHDVFNGYIQWFYI